MNAVELLKGLRASGTGLGKILQARDMLREKRQKADRMSGHALLVMMGKIWPEGTLKKALNLIEGRPAEAPAPSSPMGFEVDEFLRGLTSEEEDENARQMEEGADDIETALAEAEEARHAPAKAPPKKKAKAKKAMSLPETVPVVPSEDSEGLPDAPE